jgi:hypothetical protein
MNGKNGNSTAEFDKTMTKSKQLTLTSGWTKWWDSWKSLSSNEKWWIMEIILIFHEHSLTIGNANPILTKTTTRLLWWNSYWRIKAKKKTLSGIAWQSRPCGQVDKPLSTTLIPYKVHEGGGGVPQKGRGRFSNLNTKPDTDSQSYLNIQYNSQGFQKKNPIGGDE